MSLHPTSAGKARPLGDHSADLRMIMLTVAAIPVGIGAALGAWLLIRLIAVATNLFWFGRLSASRVEITDAHLGLLTVAIPAIGGLLIGLMARFGSEKIKGHGIGEDQGARHPRGD